MKNSWLLLCSICICVCYSCGSNAIADAPVGENGTSSHEARRMDKGTVEVLNRWTLPPALQEVSGIAYAGNNEIACIQDETGTIYLYNLQQRKVVNEIAFAGAGDYEGIALAGNDAFVLRADGLLYHVKNYRSAKPGITQHQTGFNMKNDMEGLCYDASTKQLLMVAKEKDPFSTSYKGVYGFNPGNATLNEEPVYILAAGETEGKKKGKKGKGGKGGGNNFKPSGIWRDAAGSELFMVDGTKSLLLKLTRGSGTPVVIELDKNDFPQPEGITQDEKGNIFISSEGTNGPGSIIQVKLPS